MVTIDSLPQKRELGEKPSASAMDVTCHSGSLSSSLWAVSTCSTGTILTKRIFASESRGQAFLLSSAQKRSFAMLWLHPRIADSSVTFLHEVGRTSRSSTV